MAGEMAGEHDFKRYPELTNAEMETLYYKSPHVQVFENFDCKCVKVHDGDTITVRWERRKFDFPVRFINIAAPEMSEAGGKEAQKWLEQRLVGQDITVEINPRNRVEKWGRLLGRIVHRGVDVGEEEVASGMVTTWANRKQGKIPSVEWVMPEIK